MWANFVAPKPLLGDVARGCHRLDDVGVEHLNAETAVESVNDGVFCRVYHVEREE